MTSPLIHDDDDTGDAACAALRTACDHTQRRVTARGIAVRQAIRARSQLQIDDADRILLAGQARTAAQASDRNEEGERHGITVGAIGQQRSRLTALISDLQRCRRSVGITRSIQRPAGAPVVVSGSAGRLHVAIARELDRSDTQLQSIVAGRSCTACRPAALLIRSGIVALLLTIGLSLLSAVTVPTLAMTAVLVVAGLLCLTVLVLNTAHDRRVIGSTCDDLWEDLLRVQASLVDLEQVVCHDPRASDRLGVLAYGLVALGVQHAALVAQATASADRAIALARQREARLHQRCTDRCERAVSAERAAAAAASHTTRTVQPVVMLTRSA
jgi:hypothetical protein